MADKTYTITYDASSAAKAAQAIDLLIAALVRLDAILDKVTPKLRALGKGTSAGFTALVKALQPLVSLLSVIQGKLDSFNSAARRAGSASAYAASGVKGVGAAAGTSAKQLGSAAANAQKAAAGVNNMGAAAMAAIPQLSGAATAAATLRSNVGQLNVATKAASGSMGLFTARMIAIQSVRAVLHGVLEESEKIEEHWKKMAQEASDFRESLRELASLRGEKGPNNNVTGAVLDLALQAHISPAKATAFSQAYENIGPTVREKGHYKPTVGTPEQLETDIVSEAAKTAKRLGVDEKAAGEAIGIAGMFHTFTSKEDAMEQLGGGLKGLSEGKLDYTLGVTALSKGAAKLLDPKEAGEERAVAGKLESYAEAGVYMGALSLGTGTADQAQHRMVQLSRVLNPDATQEEARTALKTAGINPDMTDPQKLVQLNKYLKAKKVADPSDWLVEHKLGSKATRESTVAGFKVADVLEERLAKLNESQKTNATGKSAIADNAAFLAKDLAGQAAAVDAVKAAQDLAEGIEGPEVFEKAKQAAEERRRAANPNEPYSPAAQLVEMDSMVNPLYWISQLGSGVGVRAYEEENNPRYGAIPQLKAEAKRVGVDISQHLPALESSNPKTRADAFGKAARAVTGKGGDPLGIQPLTDAARKRVDATRPPDAAQRVAPAAAPNAAAPAVGPLAPGIGAPQASTDMRRLEHLNAEQLRALVAINREIRNLGSDDAPRGDLPFDGGGFGALRA